MRIAVTHENGNVFPHFGHTKEFKIFDSEDGKILSSALVNTAGSGHGALAGFLKNLGVDCLICGGIGGGAKEALKSAGIEIYPGVNGNVDEKAKLLAEGKLEFNPDVLCTHHKEGHTCSGHSCSE